MLLTSKKNKMRKLKQKLNKRKETSIRKTCRGKDLQQKMKDKDFESYKKKRIGPQQKRRSAENENNRKWSKEMHLLKQSRELVSSKSKSKELLMKKKSADFVSFKKRMIGL